MPDHIWTPHELEPVATHWTYDEAYDAIARAWHAYYGSDAPRDVVIMLVAQSSLETGHYVKMYCHNLGNVKSAQGDGRCWTYYACGENVTLEHARGDIARYPGMVSIASTYVRADGVKMADCRYIPRHPQCRFRAYEGAEDGAIDYVATICRCYDNAIPLAKRGDPLGFVAALKARGYFTAPLQPYQAAIASLYGSLQRSIAVRDVEPLTDADRTEILARLALAYDSDARSSV